jgi:hypothetical protein
VRRPQTVAGGLWLEQYMSAVQRYFVSGGQDAAAVRDGARALGALLDREPGYAREVRQFAVHFGFGAQALADAGSMGSLVQVALDAEVVSPDLAAEPSLADLLLVNQADVERREGRRLDGLTTLKRLAARTGPEPPRGPLNEFAAARASLVRAELDELDREFHRAAGGFDRCRRLMAGQLGDDERERSAADDFQAQVFGPRDATLAGQEEGLHSVFRLLQAQTYVRSLLGCLRTATPAAGPARPALATELVTTLSRYGLVYEESPFLLVDAIAALSVDDAERLIAAFDRARAERPARLLGQVELAGLAPDLADEVRRRTADATSSTEADDIGWSVAMNIARGRVLELAAVLEAAEDAYRRAVDLAATTPYGLTKVCAIGAFASFRHRSGRLHDGVARLFLVSLGAAIQAGADVFDDLRFRALIDEPVAAITSWALAQPDALATAEGRLRLSVLLDLARRRRQPAADVCFSVAGAAELASAAVEVHSLLANTIERITASVVGQVGVLVLVRHSDDRGGYFLTIDRDGAAIWPSADLTAVLDDLDDAAERMVQLRPAGGRDAVADAAGAAFAALPAEVQACLRRAAVLLVVPDYRGEDSVLPYELLHDGGSYLMESRVVSRFTSLEHLANTLDSPVARRRTQRALVTAAPEGIPARPLPTALPERDAIQVLLADTGFDAPVIDPVRLSPDFYRDRLPYIDLVHVAAHGESAAGTEYVVLQDGRRLSVDDLSEAPAPWMPFVYLNTCQLARTRYLGGGQGRGLAYTCSELGASAVMANTSDVLDEVSMTLAVGFYEAAQQEPVGEAQRTVRQRAIEAGYHPSLVGRVVLFGDPFYSLVRGAGEPEPEPELATMLLDGFLGLIDGETKRQEIWDEVQLALTSRTAGHRLVAAAQLMQLLDQGEVAETSEVISAFTDAISVADALRYPPAEAILRFYRSDQAVRASMDTAEEWTQEAIRYLRRFEGRGEPWQTYLLTARANLGRRKMQEAGITVTQRGPEDTDPADLESITTLIAGMNQAQEEMYGRAELRPREHSLHDITWNAVVIGHPNRFDEADATLFGRRLSRKLIERGAIPESGQAYAPEMLIGLLMDLWSTQKVSYLEPDLVEVQAATLEALISDIRDSWSPPPDGSSKHAVDSFVATVDQTLASLDGMSWEEVVPAIKDRIPALGRKADEVLDRVARADPFALAGSAAYLTGVLAAKNTFSPLDGSVPESIHDELVKAMTAVSLHNDDRFFPYLSAGYRALHDRPPDELTRWRAEGA